jgi:hypothetical protein
VAFFLFARLFHFSSPALKYSIYFMSVLTGATVPEVSDASAEFLHSVDFIVDEDPVPSYSL